MSFALRPPRPRHPYWTAIITTPEGRRYERSTKCARKTEARDVAARWDRQASVSRHFVTLEQALDTLYQHKTDRGASEATLQILDLKGGHLLGHFGKDVLVDAITYADCAAYIRARRAKVSDSTIEKELRQLTGACRVLARLGMYSGDARAIFPGDMLKPGRTGERWLDVSEFEKLHMRLHPRTGYERGGEWVPQRKPMGHDWSEHLAGYVYSGARLSELYRLTADDLHGSQLHIRGTKTRGSDRLVDLSPHALEFFRDRARRFPAGALFPVLCVDRRGRPDAKNQGRAWQKALTRACKEAQIPRASTNDLRRTFCSWSCQAGVPEWLVVRWMGHGSGQMVRRVYARSGPKHGASEAAKLPAPQLRHTHEALEAPQKHREGLQ